ncbi:hypothetical protein [Paenibacillus gansuensis]|uniref:Butirosin biosynthesis protein H N-terminal domain-containing protein n=1 Tax=Paenibacillus gansuensis TaxID=306542 RepID=A0ABW5PKH9_9BACL
MNWVYSNYFQLYCNSNFNEQNLFYDYLIDTVKVNPYVDYQLIEKNTFDSLGYNLIEYIIEMINQGYYIMIKMDMYYITNRFASNHLHYYHNELISGYDMQTGNFLIYGFGKKGKLTLSSIDFGSFIKSTRRSPNFTLLKSIEHPQDYEFDIKLIIKEIAEYLNYNKSENILYDTNVVYGVNTYDIIIKFIKDYLSDSLNNSIYSSFFRIRKQIYVLWEHKKIMLDRILFYEKLGIIKNISHSYLEIESTARMVLHLLLKSDMVKDKTVFSKSINALIELKSKEIKILNVLLFNLKS